jgi:hypothetical protein
VRLPSRRTRRIGAPLASLAAVVALAPSADAAKPPLTHVSCGDSVTQSIRVANNLSCADDGLTIGANKIVLDLNGHLIRGDSDAGINDFGVQDISGHNRVTIRNGVIADFDHGVQMEGTTNSKMSGVTVVRAELLAVNLIGGAEGNTVSANSVIGGPAPDFGIISVTDSSENLVAGNRLVGSAIRVLGTEAGSANIIRGNVIDDPPGPGIDLRAAVDTRVSGNRVTGGGVGVNIGTSSPGNVGSTGNTVDRNAVLGAASHGFQVTAESSDNTFSENQARANGASGYLVLGDDNTFTEDRGSGNRTDGIAIDLTGSSNAVRRGSYSSNGDDGITSFGTGVVVKRNTVNFNGFLNGIDGGSGAGVDAGSGTSGSGNAAKGNSLDAQCTEAALCQVTAALNPPLLPCATPLSNDAVLRHPLDCGDDAIVVGAPGIEVDLRKQYVSGGSAGLDHAVDNQGGHDDVTVLGGVLVATDRGIFVDTAEGNLFDGTVVTSMDDDGIFLAGATNNRFRDVKVLGGSNGAFLDEADGNRIANSSFLGSDGSGIVAQGVAGGALLRNRVLGAAVKGIALSAGSAATAADRTEVTGNTVTGSLEHGIAVLQSSFTPLEDNLVKGGGDDGILAQAFSSPLTDVSITENHSTANAGHGVNLASGGTEAPVDTVLRENVLSKNAFDGALLNDTSTDTRAVANVFSQNGLHGLEMDPSSTAELLRRNVAKRNGFGGGADDDFGLGIFAVAATPGSGNVAAGNDDPDQCEPASLC